MIDTGTIYIPMTRKMGLHLRNHSRLCEMGIITSGNTLFLRHPFLNDNYKVHLDMDKCKMIINQSLPKLLQGHNVFGINRLQFLCIEITKLIYRQLGLEWSDKEQHLIGKRRFRLGRMDLAANYLTEFPDQVLDILNAIFEHLRTNSKSWSGYSNGGGHIGTTYHQQDSTRWSAKFYNKQGELLVRTIPKSVVERDRILEYAARLVRFELTIRGKELARLGLQYADQWTRARVIELLQEHIAKFAFSGVIKSCLEPDELDGLNLGCKTFYRLWRRGANLRRYGDYTPIRRARKTLLAEHDVDIYRQPRMGCDVALNEFLIEENAYFVGPKALTRRGAIFGV
jgi:hypothetical protein